MQLRDGLKMEIVGVCLISLSLLGFICLLNPATGILGSVLERVLKVLFGEGRFMLPLLIGVLGWRLITGGLKVQLAQNICGSVLLLLMLLTLIHTLIPYDYTARSLLQGDGGGLIGAALSALFQQSFGRAGTYIIVLTMGLVGLLMSTGLSLHWLTGFMVSRGQQGVKKNLAGGVKLVQSVLARRKGSVNESLPMIIDCRDKVHQCNQSSQDEEEPEQDSLSEELVHIDEVAVSSDRINEQPEEHTGINYPQLVFSRESQQKCNPGDILRPSLKSGNTLLNRQNKNYTLPPLDLLQVSTRSTGGNVDSDIAQKVRALEETLRNFGVKARVIRVSRGPAITRYEIQPPPGVKVSRIVGLADDIALGMATSGVRIEAPIPGLAAVGIEVPNSKISTVRLRDLLETDVYWKARSCLTVALGKDIAGHTVTADLTAMPHLLIAGATGSGKSVCLNTIIVSILFKAAPEQVKFLIVDPKMVELATYNGIPHLVAPVVTDPKKAATVLRWAVKEMEYRYELFAGMGARDLEKYNAIMRQRGRKEEQLPLMVIVIDELADLMMVAPADVEDAVCRLAQMARAGGMHLVVATQRPSVDVITGLIKANIPSRISFSVSSQIDSRTILDMTGAEKLLGRGDMLFYPVGSAKPIRLQGAFVSDREVELLVNYLRKQAVSQDEKNIPQELIHAESPGPDDELMTRAAQLIIDTGQASISLLQRRLRIGYARAARLMDMLERRGIVGGPQGSKGRAVLMSQDQYRQTLK